MITRGPLITLGAVVVLVGVLLVVNTLVGPPVPPAGIAAGPAGATSSPPTSSPPTTSAAPAPTSSQPAALQAVFAGVTSGDEATVAIAVNNDKAAAYLCDGESIEAWLDGSVTGDQIALTGGNGARLTGSISGSAMFGTVTTNSGQILPFSAGLAGPPAGVYQARLSLDGLATRIGWAVLPDGTQVGLATVGPDKRPAPQFDVKTRNFTLDGVAATADVVVGSDTVVRR
jgi:hypothetical protein